jgi:hypothetical protein
MKSKKKTPKLGSGARYKKLVNSLKKGGAKNPKALAAHIGRKKYGKKKFQELALKGKKSKKRKA